MTNLFSTLWFTASGILFALVLIIGELPSPPEQSAGGSGIEPFIPVLVALIVALGPTIAGIFTARKVTAIQQQVVKTDAKVDETAERVDGKLDLIMELKVESGIAQGIQIERERVATEKLAADALAVQVAIGVAAAAAILPVVPPTPAPVEVMNEQNPVPVRIEVVKSTDEGLTIQPAPTPEPPKP